MRIIAGKHRGRKIESPEGKRVRPTSDMVRGAIFNMLQNMIDWENCNVLDVCCGTGAFGLEALSRGAKFVGFIDSHRESLNFAEKNIVALKEQERSKIYAAAIEKLPRANIQYDLIFIDPPYKQGLVDIAIESLFKHDWIAENALLILEMEENEILQKPDALNIIKERIHGKTKVIFGNLKSKI